VSPLMKREPRILNNNGFHLADIDDSCLGKVMMELKGILKTKSTKTPIQSGYWSKDLVAN